MAMRQRQFPQYDWPVPERRTHAEQVVLAEKYDLEAADVLILKAMSYGLTIAETAEVTGWAIETIRGHTAEIPRQLRAKNMPHAVANAFRLGIIS